jgi:hypothetical protein
MALAANGGNMELLNSGLIALFLAVVPVVIGLSLYLSWKRRKALGELAASMGLPFLAVGPELYFLEATGLEIFRLGRSRKASNLIRVSIPACESSFFDYSCSTGGGKNRKTHSFTLALIECMRCQAPYFDLKPESFIYKLGEVIGFKDIDLPAFPLFSDKYRLTGADAAAVHLFFTPARAAWFERNPGLRVQGAKNFLVMFKREVSLPVDAWPGFIEEAKAFCVDAM